MQGDSHRYGISQYFEGGIDKVAMTSGTLASSPAKETL